MLQVPPKFVRVAFAFQGGEGPSVVGKYGPRPISEQLWRLGAKPCRAVRASRWQSPVAAVLLSVCALGVGPSGLVGDPWAASSVVTGAASLADPVLTPPQAPTRQAAVIPVPAPDTLDILLERVRSLEAQVDALRAASDSARALDAALDSILAHERLLLAEQLAALRHGVILLTDSVAASNSDAVRVELEEGIGSIRAEGVRAREALSGQLLGVAETLNVLESRLGLWEREVRDSLTATAGQIQLERQERQAADSRSRFLLAIATGLLLVGVAVVWWRWRGQIAAINKRVAIGATVDARIEEVRRELGAEVGREGQRLLEEQLKPLEGISRMLAKISDAGRGAELDHDLAVGVCNEVNRIEKNLAGMDASVKGHRQLTGCVRRVKENLRVHRYNITELLGRDYDGGMHVEADFVEDQQLTAGRRVITRINRPEVRYMGKIIQNASVKVSVGF